LGSVPTGVSTSSPAACADIVPPGLYGYQCMIAEPSVHIDPCRWRRGITQVPQPLFIQRCPLAIVLYLRQHPVDKRREFRMLLVNGNAVGLVGEGGPDDLGIRILAGESR